MSLFSRFLDAIKPVSPASTFIMEVEKNPLIQDNDISPSNISWAINLKKEYDKIGNLNQLYRKFLENDDNLGSALDVRTEALKTTKPHIPEDTPHQIELQKIADDLWADLCELTLEKKLFGFLFRQRIWEQQQDLSIIPNRYKTYNRIDLRIQNDSLVYYEDDQPKTLPEAKFIMQFQNKAILQSLLKYYCFFTFCLNNWARFTETYGKPIRLGKYEPGTPKPERDALWNMIKSAGTDMAAMISKNTTLEFIDFANKTASKDIYESLVKFTEDRVTRRILGQTLTTTAEKTGSYAQSKIHDLVRKDILSGDIRDLKKLAQSEINLIALINYGINYVPFSIESPSTVDLNERIKIDNIVKDIIQIPDDYFYNTYSYPKPENIAPPVKTPVKTEVKPKINLSPSSPLNVHLTYAAEDHIKKVTEQVNKLLSKIKKLNSLDDLNDLPFPTALYFTFGYQMQEQILKTYAKTRIEHSKAKNLSPESSLISRRNYRFSNFSLDDLIEFSWALEDYEAMAAFSSEAFIVAGVSIQNSLQQLKDDAADAVKNGLTFNEWREKAALNGFEPDNPYYLRTNFNTAVNNSYAAAEWQNIQDDIDVLPFLQYSATLDDKTRPDHAAMHGTIAKVNDPLWNTWYPPNDWNCRCDVIQLTAAEAESDPNFGKKPPDIKLENPWAKNSGKDKTIWGSFLSCTDKSKNYSKSSRLPSHGTFADMSHCPKNYSNSYKDNDRPEWNDLSENNLPDLKDTDNLNRQQLLDLYKDFLADRTIIDVSSLPVFLGSDKALKFFNSDKYSTADLRGRFKYLNCIDDTLQNPTEIWLDENKSRIRYLKKYSKNVMLLVDIEYGQMNYFNIVISNDSYINKQRKGFLAWF